MSFEGNPITRTTQCTNHSIYGTNFIRTWNVQLLWKIYFRSSPKLGQHHNKVGGVIWWVFWEIQSPELCNALATKYTERTSIEHEMSNFFDQLISDPVQNLGNITIRCEESFGGFCGNPIIRTTQCTNHYIYGTNFIRTWCVQFFWPFDFGSCPKHWQHHNMVGGVIWWVLREI